MHPYRDPAHAEPTNGGKSPGEEWVIAALLAALGTSRVAIAIARHEDFAVDVTIAGILGVIGLVLLAKLAFAALGGARRS